MKSPSLFALSVLAAPLMAVGAVRFSESPRRQPGSSPVRDTVSCLDTLHASDSINAVVKMSVKPQLAKTKLPPDFEGLFVQEFRSRLKVPSNLPLSVMRGWSPCDSVSHKCLGGVLMLGSQAYATAHSDGAVSRIMVIDLALTPALADTVRVVLLRMANDKAVPFFNGPDSIPLDISIGVEQHPDTVPAWRHLFRASIPHYGFQFTQAEWPKNAKGPKYPSIAERARVADSVTLTFTILSDGTVAPQSVDLQSYHYADFIRSVFERMATMRYVPGLIGTCPVATWQKQSFMFRMPWNP
jgi:TonB family protein